MAHSHTVHLPLGALLIWRTMCGTGCLTPSLAALAAQVPMLSALKQLVLADLVMPLSKDASGRPVGGKWDSTIELKLPRVLPDVQFS